VKVVKEGRGGEERRVEKGSSVEKSKEEGSRVE
jgi:hypothetical protein